jgi:hypothetical protein
MAERRVPRVPETSQPVLLEAIQAAGVAGVEEGRRVEAPATVPAKRVQVVDQRFKGLYRSSL